VKSHFGFCSTTTAFLATILAGWGCSSASPVSTITCSDTRVGHPLRQNSPWILRIDEAHQTAEMIVHVPADSVRRGTPEGNRSGRVHVSERAYEVTIPADSGGEGAEAWSRMQFTFEVDRFTGAGTAELGERKYGETLQIPVQCEAETQGPNL